MGVSVVRSDGSETVWMKGQEFLRLELIGLKELVRKSFEAACAKVASETACPVYRVKLG